MLTLNGATKTFFPGTPNQRVAVNGVSFTVRKSDFVTIIGGNGAGKSTLFHLIAGSLTPECGSVTLGGADVTYLPEYRRAAHIGRLFQDPLRGTAPTMTLEENLALAYGRGSRRGLGIGISKQNRELFHYRLSALGMGLEERMKEKVGLFSGGQRQVLTLLMATILPPKLLLLDEHTAALDPATAEKVLALTKEIVSRDGITTLMITHNLKGALALGNRTFMLQNGRLLFELSGEERKEMTVERLIQRFHQQSGEALDNDRMLLS